MQQVNPRGVIDRYVQRSRGTGPFLLLGPASIDLLTQSSESLAGRATSLELRPLDAREIAHDQADQLWPRGGLPGCFLAKTDIMSRCWRNDFISTYLDRDIPKLGFRIPAITLRRFWTMLAHHQGGLHNAAANAQALELHDKTVTHYLDVLVDLLLVRRLPP